MDDSEDSLVLTLLASTVAPGVARRDVRHWLAAQGVNPEAIEVVELVVSELVTNSVEHTDSAPELEVTRRSDGVRVSVRDGDGRGPVARSGGAGGGFGLHIVAQTSRAWGWEPVGDGKVVWADLAID